MTEQQTRYDRIALGYSSWWAPVLVSSAEALLDLVEGELRAADAVVDVGTGTGTLALGVVRRHPRPRVLGIDASEAMLDVARDAADTALDADARARVTFAQAFADAIPAADLSVDVVVSSFVYQLVPSRFRALVDARRVLRPGGVLAYVAWLVGGGPWAPDRILDDALDEAGFEPPEPEERPGEIISPEAAATQARRAGFRNVRAERRELSHAFTPESYLGFVEEFDEEDTFASMSGRTRERARRRILTGVGALSDAERTLRLPIVYVTGQRPG